MFIFLFVLALGAELKYDEIATSEGPSAYEFQPESSDYLTITVSSETSATLLLKQEKLPSESDFDFKFTNSLIIPSESLNSDKTYFLLIICPSQFSVLLTKNFYSSISDSVPIKKSLFEARQDLYIYTIPSNQQKITITLTYFIGKADLLVSQTDPNYENSFLTENWHFGQTLELPLNLSEIKISIIGYKNTEYTLVINAGKEILMNSEALSGLVSESQINRYKYTLPPSSTLKIKLSIFSGDCDLYIKVNSKVEKNDYHWAFTDHGSKIVEITQDQQKAHPGFEYFIGVYGKLSSAYLLIISSNSNNITKMASGLPYIGTVRHREIEYYSIELQTDENLQIHLSAATGNPDLYAKKCDGCFFSNKDITSPDSEITYSNNAYGLEEMSISGKGKYTIGVYGESLDYSEYTIVCLVNNSEMLLRAGSPQTGMIPDSGYRYYKYNLFKITANQLYFMLTPISGNPDLYVSLSNSPTTEDYDSSSSLQGLEVDSITYLKGRDYNSLNGTYHIAVYSKSPSRFSIVVKEIHPDGNTTIQLYPGIPQKDTLYDSCMNYRLYYFPVHFSENNAQPIRINLTPITGKFHIYATNRIENIDFNHRIFWYYWEFAPSGNELVNSLVIDPSYANYLRNSNYAVLVKASGFSSDKSATYSIVLQIGNGTMILSDNSPFIDVLSSFSYNYYVFPVTLKQEDVSVTLTAFSGKPKLYLSVNNTHPSTNDYQFSSTRNGNDEILITWDQISDKCPSLSDVYHHGDPTHCNLFVSVFSNTSASYSLTLHATRNIIKFLGVPSTQISLLSSSKKHFYTIVTSERDIFINAQPNIGQVKVFVKVYSSIKTDINSISMPNSSFYDYVSEVYMLHSERVRISSYFLNFTCENNCLVAITVECLSQECEFFISTTQDQLINLIDGEAFLGSVEQDEFMYFSYYCNREDQDFIIVLSPVSFGDPDMFVKKSVEELPTQSDYH